MAGICASQQEEFSVPELSEIADSRVMEEPYPHDVDRTNYRTYLSTDHWRQTRKRVLLLHGNRCDVCGSTEKLRCHHVDYGFCGWERYKDLAVLCEKDHLRFHQLDALTLAAKEWLHAQEGSVTELRFAEANLFSVIKKLVEEDESA